MTRMRITKLQQGGRYHYETVKTVATQWDFRSAAQSSNRTAVGFGPQERRPHGSIFFLTLPSVGADDGRNWVSAPRPPVTPGESRSREAILDKLLAPGALSFQRRINTLD